MATHLIAYVPYAAAAYCVAKVGQYIWPSLRSQLATATRFSTMHGLDGEDPVESRRAADCPGGPEAYFPAALRNWGSASSFAGLPPCPPGYSHHPVSGDCVRPPCPPGYSHHPVHGNCVKPTLPGASNPYLRNAPPYCFNLDTQTIDGTGPLDGVQPPATTVAVWTDEDGTQLASINVSGDNMMTIPVCGGPDNIPPPLRTPTPEDPQRTPTPPTSPQRTPTPRLPPPPPESCGRRRPGPLIPKFRHAACNVTERNAHRDRIASRRRRWG